MKTHLTKLTLLILALAAAAGTARAQRFFVRGDVGIAAASESPYDTAGAAGSIAIGSTLDAASQHELSLSLGFLAWAEPEVKGFYPDDVRGITTMRIDDEYYDIPTGNDRFAIDGDHIVLGNGARFDADYRPTLAIAPVMAHYRINFGGADSRVRFFVGAGAGLARMRMESELWKEFKRYTNARSQSDSVTKFTWSGTAGLSVKIVDRLRVDASYVYQSFESADFRTANISMKLDRLETHQFRGGVTWMF